MTSIGERVLRWIGWGALALWAVTVTSLIWSVWVDERSFWYYDASFDLDPTAGNGPGVLDRIRASALALGTTGSASYLIVFALAFGASVALQQRREAQLYAMPQLYAPQPYPMAQAPMAPPPPVQPQQPPPYRQPPAPGT